VIGTQRWSVGSSVSWAGTLQRGSFPGQDPCRGSDPHRPLALRCSFLSVANGCPGCMRIGASTGQRYTCQVESPGDRGRPSLGHATTSATNRIGPWDRGEAARARTRTSVVRYSSCINRRIRTVSNQSARLGAPYQIGAACHGTLCGCDSCRTRV